MKTKTKNKVKNSSEYFEMLKELRGRVNVINELTNQINTPVPISLQFMQNQGMLDRSRKNKRVVSVIGRIINDISKV